MGYGFNEMMNLGLQWSLFVNEDQLQLRFSLFYGFEFQIKTC